MQSSTIQLFPMGKITRHDTPTNIPGSCSMTNSSKTERSSVFASGTHSLHFKLTVAFVSKSGTHCIHFELPC